MGCVACQHGRVHGDDEDSSGPTTSWLEDHQEQCHIETVVQNKTKTPSPSLSSAEESFEEVESAIPKVLQHTRASAKAKRKRHSSKAKEFWAAQSKQIAKEKKERKKRAQKLKKKKQWKFQTEEKPKVKIESVCARMERVPSVRDSKGNLRMEIADVKTRSQNLEKARAEEEKKLAEDVERMRQKRDNSMRKLDPSEFKAAQEVLSRTQLKKPDDYELANNENTETLLKGMKDIFENDSTDKTLTEEREEKFVDLLQSAGILVSAPADSSTSLAAVKTESKIRPELFNEGANLLLPTGKSQVEQAKQKVFKEINLNGSQFLHTAKEKDKEVFVSTLCQLFKRKSKFEAVKFNYGALNEQNVVQIAESLQKCESLQEVYFDSNDFGGTGVRALINLMDAHKDTLTTLSMQNLPTWQNLSTELLREFVEAIERSKALVKLGFDLKEFRHHEYKDRVSKALKRNSEIARVSRLKKKREKSKDFSR